MLILNKASLLIVYAVVYSEYEITINDVNTTSIYVLLAASHTNTIIKVALIELRLKKEC